MIFSNMIKNMLKVHDYEDLLNDFHKHMKYNITLITYLRVNNII